MEHNPKPLPSIMPTPSSHHKQHHQHQQQQQQQERRTKQLKRKPKDQQQQRKLAFSRVARCPCCNVTLPMLSIHSHLNSCLAASSSPTSSTPPELISKPSFAPEPCSQNSSVHEESEKQPMVFHKKDELSGESTEPDQERVMSSRPKVFPIFLRPQKVVHLIRHGHTSYSAYLDFSTAPSRRQLFDVRLTDLGIQQASDLGRKLVSLKPDVIITSPLTRALQTLSWAGKTSEASDLQMEVSALHTEHVACSGDVGRPASLLASEFPWLSFSNLEDVWWFSPKHAPNDPIAGVFQSKESLENLRKRVAVFRQFLFDRREQVIAVIGHSTFFKVLLNKKERMNNCQIMSIKM